MEADYFIVSENGDEAWYNTICPECDMWYELDDYERLP
jgi:hypothetical protein